MKAWLVRYQREVEKGEDGFMRPIEAGYCPHNANKEPRDLSLGLSGASETGFRTGRRSYPTGADAQPAFLLNTNINFLEAECRCPGAFLMLLQSNLTPQPSTYG